MKRACARCGVTVTAETWTVSDWPCGVEGCGLSKHFYCARISDCATRERKAKRARILRQLTQESQALPGGYQ